MAPRLCLFLPLALLLGPAGCCWTPGPDPSRPPSVDGGTFVVGRDGGPFIFPDTPPRPDTGPDPVDGGPTAGCTMEILGGALCDEPCVAPARRITCPGGIQHVSVAAMDDGTSWLSATYPPRLLHRVGESLEEHGLPLRGEGHVQLLLDATGGLRALYTDESLAIGSLPDESGRLRLELRTGRAYWVSVGAGIDDADALHVAWIDDGPALHAASGPISDAASFVDREVSPTYFADSAMTLGPDGMPHVAFWQHRVPTDLGRDLMVRDGDAAAHAIGFHAEPNDDGTNVSIAASASELLASLDFADGIHVLVPDDSIADTGYRDVWVPGTTPLALTGCPGLPPPGPPPGTCEPTTCTETGSGTIRRAHELVALGDGRFALLWLERQVSRDIARELRCGGPGCVCVDRTLSESSTTDLVLGLIDETTGLPARTLVIPVGDLETWGLATSLRGTRLVVAMQEPELTAVLVEIDLSFVLP